ncbi:MAG: aldehyde dehydrogenase family protein, partial [Micrococcales bacterium]|nr:aldehyde dehydrogenase family protein [Micrococcales bacterium]
GSQQAGMALAGLSAARPVPIPVFSEMGTVNPVVVTSAAQARAVTIGAGCANSFTMGMGQFCTKPGLVLAPRGSDIAEEIVSSLRRGEPRGPLLTSQIAGSYAAGIGRLLAAGATTMTDVVAPGPGTAVSAVVLAADADLLQPGSSLIEECFGPVVVVVEYDDATHRDAILGRLQGCLVATVMSDGPDDPELPDLVAELTGLAGRVVVDAWPTGVATTWAQHHGGPWPSTTSPASTSVGSGALDRFTRPVAYQGVAGTALPIPLRTENAWDLPRRVDGSLTTPMRPVIEMGRPGD